MKDIQALLKDLRSSDWWTREKSIEGLVVHPDESYLPMLAEWLSNEDDALLRNAAMEAYRALGGRALDPLISFVKGDDTDVKVLAANLLGEIGDSAALDALVESLEDKDVNVRAASAEALGKIGDERADAALAGMLTDLPWAAMAAIGALGEIGGEGSLRILHHCLDRAEYFYLTCASIEKAGDQHSIGYLFPYLDRPDLREAALKAIVTIAEREGGLTSSCLSCFVPFLHELMSSPDAEMRRAAFIGLSWAEDARALPAFIRSVSDADLQEYAVKGLISLGKQAVPGIVDALRNPGGGRGMLAKILSMSGENEALLMFADDEDPEVRTEVSLAIGSLKTPAAEAALRALSQDPVEEVRDAASLSLRNFGRK